MIIKSFIIAGINMIYHRFNLYTLAFGAIIVLTVIALPRALQLQCLVRKFGRRAVEIELRFIFAVLLSVSLLADLGKLQAIFGAFILGIVFSNSINGYGDIIPKLRAITFSLLP